MITIEISKDEVDMIAYIAGKALQTAERSKRRTKSELCRKLYADDVAIISGFIDKLSPQINKGN